MIRWIKRWLQRRTRIYVPRPTPEATIRHKDYYRVTPVRRTI